LYYTHIAMKGPITPELGKNVRIGDPYVETSRTQ
jgi:hypothetical protein